MSKSFSVLSKVWQRLWLKFFLLLLVTGCATGTMTDRFDATELPTELSPTPTLPSGYVFPRRELVDGELASMASEIYGKLVKVNGCLRLESSYDGRSYLVIWPPNYQLDVKNDEIQILDESGQVLAVVGQEIHMGGGIGETLEDNIYVTEKIIREIPPECPGPYWIGGRIVSEK
jgi:hypothetical protein